MATDFGTKNLDALINLYYKDIIAKPRVWANYASLRSEHDAIETRMLAWGAISGPMYHGTFSMTPPKPAEPEINEWGEVCP